MNQYPFWKDQEFNIAINRESQLYRENQELKKRIKELEEEIKKLKPFNKE